MKTIQQAAYEILKEKGVPLPSKDLAKEALHRGFVGSRAQDPVHSLSQTIEKNIRAGYNQQGLKFMGPRGDRRIGLAKWEDEQGPRSNGQIRVEVDELRARIPTKLLEQVRLAHRAHLASTFDEVVATVILSGLRANKDRIRNGVLEVLEQLEQDNEGNGP